MTDIKLNRIEAYVEFKKSIHKIELNVSDVAFPPNETQVYFEPLGNVVKIKRDGFHGKFPSYKVLESEYTMLADRFMRESELVDRETMDDMIARVDDFGARLIHHSMGMSGESGELLDAVKKYIMYGKELDIVNIKEECGDILWYMARMLKLIGSDFGEVMKLNNEKLNGKRYKDGYSNRAAIERADKQDE